MLTDEPRQLPCLLRLSRNRRDGEQLLRLLIAEHEHLALLTDIDVVDEAAVEHLHLVNLVVVGIDATHLRADILLPQTDGARGAILCTHLVDVVCELAGGDSHVALMQTDVTSLLQSLVGHRRLAAEDHHRTGEEAVVLLYRRIDEAIAGSQEHDEHEDAPRHGEARQRCAQLVASRRLPDFIQ